MLPKTRQGYFLMWHIYWLISFWCGLTGPESEHENLFMQVLECLLFLRTPHSLLISADSLSYRFGFLSSLYQNHTWKKENRPVELKCLKKKSNQFKDGIPWKAAGRRQLIVESVGIELKVGDTGGTRKGQQIPMRFCPSSCSALKSRP